ncbi:hypothetical protein HY251_21155 [bacterium]|nr:hypothetical protein [bacterium]
MNDESRSLLERAALRYLAARPWEKLRDEHFFGIADRETGLEGWASVAGSDGEEFGLGIYVGKDGRRVLEKTLALDIDVERQNRAADVIALTVADEAEAGDFREGTKLPLSTLVKGKKVFPIVFRKPPESTSTRALRDREAVFLARALDAVSRTAEWGLDEDDVLDERGGRLTLSLLGKSEALEIERSYDEPKGPLDLRADLEEALHEAPRTKRFLVGFQDSTLAVFDPREKKLLHEEKTADDPAAAAARLVEILAGKGPIPARLPREIWTDAPSLEAALAPLLSRFGVKVASKLELKELRRKKP